MGRFVKVFVVAIILFLTVGLLIPAIAKVRETSDRTSCFNHLQAIGLSLKSYHEVHRFYPFAAIPAPSLPPEKRWSWLMSLAPFFEATNFYVRMEGEKGWEAEENRYLAITGLPFLQCPGFPEKTPTSIFASTHYIGIAGLGPNAAMLPPEDPSAGYFGYERKLTLTDIKAGASNLLVAIETTQANGAWTAGGSSTVRGLEDDGSPYVGLNLQFGGNLPGGANVLFADGSIRFLSESIDLRLFRAMATTQGSKEIPPE